MSLEYITEIVYEQLNTLQEFSEKIGVMEAPEVDELFKMLIELQKIDVQSTNLLLDFSKLFTELLRICEKHELTQESTIVDAVKFKKEIVLKLEAFTTR